MSCWTVHGELGCPWTGGILVTISRTVSRASVASVNVPVWSPTNETDHLVEAVCVGCIPVMPVAGLVADEHFDHDSSSIRSERSVGIDRRDDGRRCIDRRGAVDQRPDPIDSGW